MSRAVPDSNRSEFAVRGRPPLPEFASTLPASWAVLSDWVGSGRSPGVQLFVAAQGRVLADLAIGTGPTEAVSAGHSGQLLCATKPLVAIALAQAAEDGLLSLDDPISRYLEVTPDRARIRISELLSHSSGLPSIAIDPYRMSYHHCVEQAARWPIAERWWWQRPVYNRTHAWHLLSAVLETVRQDTVSAVLADRIAAPLGLSSLTLGRPDPQRYLDNYLCHAPGEFEVMAEPSRETLFSRVNPAYGGFGSVGDLGRLYLELLACGRSAGRLLSADSVADLVRPRGEVELFMGPRPLWGLGFTVDVLRDGMRGSWSSRTFGHSGALPRVRTVYAFADQERNAVFAARTFAAQARNNHYFARLSKAVSEDLDQRPDLAAGTE